MRSISSIIAKLLLVTLNMHIKYKIRSYSSQVITLLKYNPKMIARAMAAPTRIPSQLRYRMGIAREKYKNNRRMPEPLWIKIIFLV
jgi:hypothetical protein